MTNWDSRPSKVLRNWQLWADRHGSHPTPYHRLAREWGITKERVRQIVRVKERQLQHPRYAELRRP
jgi:DNA-directed RNA polymerase sigma subunit (sigma70/sigma32)